MKKFSIAAALMIAATSGVLSAKPIATVNGETIDSSVIDAQVKALITANKNAKDTPVLRQGLTERQILSTVVVQEAKRLKLDQSPEYKQALESARADAAKQGADKKANFKTEWAVFESDLLGQAYAHHIAKQNPVQEKDVRKAYDEFSKFYKGTQEIQLGEIVTDSKDKADKAAKDLAAKKDFKTVLNQYSIDNQAKKAGGIAHGYVPLKDLEQARSPLYPAVKDLKKGEATAPIQSGNVYGVFYVNDRRNVQIPAYEQIKERIGSDLQAERIDASVRALVEKANIKPAQ